MSLAFRSVKMADIGYTMAVFFSIGYLVGNQVDKFFLKLYGDYKTKTKNRLLLEVLVQVIVIAILSYLGRNLVELVPSPLDGRSGFIHGDLKEIKNGAYLTVFLFMFQYSLQDKLLHIKKLV